MHLTIETPGPTRLEVRDENGRMYQPEGALMDKTAGLRGQQPWYSGHFVTTGVATLEVPAGRYTLIAEKGVEFTRVKQSVHLTRDEAIKLTPKRWCHMGTKGWWSADFHVHRPIGDASLLIAAEDLNFGVFFTMWNKRNLWDGRELPKDPVIRVDDTHVATVMNAEDERGGGAWMLHNLREPLKLGGGGRWYPPGRDFVEAARRQRALANPTVYPIWFDCEKPIWWEAPVMAATTRIDSLGVLHNHYNQYGMLANEAWGRPRDQRLYPGYDGFSNYSLSLYYRYLNLGNRYPATAGSASGVLPAPPGYNRVYVRAPEGFSIDSFYAALSRGRSFVTNGPMLTFLVNGKEPGDTVAISSRRPLEIVADASAREAIDRMEIIANGQIAAQKSGGRLEAHLRPRNHTWLAARCYLKSGGTVRLAHTSPVYLSGPEQRWNASEDAAFFVKWMDDLIAESDTDPKRFATPEQKKEVLTLYQTASTYYRRKLALRRGR